MDIFNRGAFIVTVVTALAMVLCHQYGYSYDSAQMHLLMGVTIIPVSVILEKNLLQPRFLYGPLWALGFIPLMSGLYRLGDWPFLLIAFPVLFFCRLFLGYASQKRIHHALDVSHKLLEGDPDKLRAEIEENRAHHSTPPKPHSR